MLRQQCGRAVRRGSFLFLGMLTIVGVLLIVGCGGGGAGAVGGSSNNESGAPAPSSNESEEDTVSAVGSVDNPAKQVPIDLPLLSRIGGDVTAFDSDDEYLYVAYKYTIDMYRLSDTAFVRTVTFSGTIDDLIARDGDIFLLLSFRDLTLEDALQRRFYRFSPSSLGEVSTAPFLDLPASAYKIHDAEDRFYIAAEYEHLFFTIEATSDGLLQRLPDVVTPFSVQKIRFYGDRAVLLGSEPKPEGGSRSVLSVVNRSDFQGAVELYLDAVADFDIVADHFLAVGVDDDVQFRDLSDQSYPLVRTDPDMYPLQIEAHGTFLAITGGYSGSDFMLMAFHDSDTVDGNIFDLSGEGGVFAADFTWSKWGRAIRWRGSDLILFGWNDSLVLFSTAGADPLVPVVRQIYPRRYYGTPLQLDDEELVYSSGHHLEIWSIADPIQPQRVTQGFIGNDVVEKIVRQNGTYLVMRGGELQSWQIVGDALIQRDSLVPGDGAMEQSLIDFQVFGDLAIGGSYAQCSVVNVEDPLNLQLVATIETNCGHGFTVHGDYLLVKGSGAELAVYDLHEPEHPSLVRHYDDLFFGDIQPEFVTDDHVFSGDSYQSFLIDDPLNVQLDMDVKFYIASPDGYGTHLPSNGVVVDLSRHMVAYFDWGFTHPSQISFFRLSDDALQYLGTATVPLSIAALYGHGDLLIARSSVGEGIFFFHWPTFPDVQ